MYFNFHNSNAIAFHNSNVSHLTLGIQRTPTHSPRLEADCPQSSSMMTHRRTDSRHLDDTNHTLSRTQSPTKCTTPSRRLPHVDTTVRRILDYRTPIRTPSLDTLALRLWRPRRTTLGQHVGGSRYDPIRDSIHDPMLFAVYGVWCWFMLL